MSAVLAILFVSYLGWAIGRRQMKSQLRRLVTPDAIRDFVTIDFEEVSEGTDFDSVMEDTLARAVARTQEIVAQI